MSIQSQLKEMQDTVGNLTDRLNIRGLIAQADALEAKSGEQEFWTNPDSAQKTMQEISRLRARVEPWLKLESRISDALELAALNEPSLIDDLTAEVSGLEPIVARMSIQALLSGTNDSRDAFLAIHAGAGGTDSQDWGQMLERMYLRWA